MKYTMLLFAFLLFGCKEDAPEEHRTENNVERGIEIEVMLKGGGTATLVCPKFDSEPMSDHGRECYLREYDYVKVKKMVSEE